MRGGPDRTRPVTAITRWLPVAGATHRHGTYRRLVVRLALVLFGLAAWVGIVAESVHWGRRRRERTGAHAWPCVVGGTVVGVIVFYFIGSFAAM